LETGNVHNPHYYEWMAASGRGAGAGAAIENIACGELPRLFVFHNILLENKIDKREHFNMYRLIIHYTDVVLPEFQVDKVRDNFDLRVAYLMGEFDEEIWAMKLINRDKRRMKIAAYRELIETKILIMTDMMRQLVYEPTVEKSDELIAQYPRLAKFFMDSTYDIACLYGGAVPSMLG
jgi:hypothetical protein